MAKAPATTRSLQRKPTLAGARRRDEFGVLGNAWALSILRSAAFEDAHTFSAILRTNPGLTPRVLSRRLRELCAAGILVRSQSGRNVRYEVAPKGEDAAFILLALLRFNAKNPEESPNGSN